jgi:ferric-dicitrate binding protein FerR (iron transport regulator)
MKPTAELFELSRVIANHLAGETTIEERRVLDAWLAESPRHAALLARLGDEQVTREKLLVHERVDVEQALARFLVEKRARARRRRVTRLARRAGILLLPALAVAWWMLGREEPPRDTGDEPLLPRLESSITLTTATGERVELPATLPAEQQIGNHLLLRQDSGMTRVIPVARAADDAYRVITVPRGGEFRILLDDGTRVWINAGTTFSFPLEFTGTTRRVTLDGEAYFEVARDAGREFLVETPGAVVTARGTAFNLSTDAARERTVATLVEGAVDFLVRETGEEIAMLPGEQVVLRGEGWEKRAVNASLYTSWRDGWLSFSSERLEEMLAVVSRWYNVEIVFVNEQAKDMLYTGQVRKYEDFREVLDIISLTRSARFSVDDRVISVY